MSCKKISKDYVRLHRERHQPESRKHLGYLEKKKDYKKRATDFNEKRRIIKKLKEKAFDKNEDEFHFHMIKSRFEDGKHMEIRDDDNEFTPEQLQLMLTQDLSYIIYKRSIEQKKIDKLKSQLHMIDVPDKPKNQHIIFVDNKEKMKEISRKMKEMTDDDLLTTVGGSGLPNQEFLETVDLPDIDMQSLKEAVKKKNQKYKELVTRMNREKQLKLNYDKMVLKKQLVKDKMNATKIQSGTPESAPVYKFKAIRKR